ncbi:MAG: formylglycine-generating enzyme family protein [Aquabacterium sp.]
MGLGASAWSATVCAGGPALPSGWPNGLHAGQVRVAAGEFSMGSQHGYADERPALPSRVASFWIDRTEVTNAQFAAFVAATGHVTSAERQGGTAVFAVPTPAELKARPMAWWRYVKGADWRHPQGPSSSIKGKANWPVVHVTQADALAYAQWLGRDLPTEAEWEYAAKAGRQGPELDAAPRNAQGKPAANYWQGNFPLLDTAEDGHAGVAPVGCYAPNAWGLYDMIGNVWEWTKDAYRGPRQPHANGDPALVQPRPVSLDQGKAVIKGGSYLCAPDYCVRYRASARESQEPDVATSHVGFRTVSRQ